MGCRHSREMVHNSISSFELRQTLCLLEGLVLDRNLRSSGLHDAWKSDHVTPEEFLREHCEVKGEYGIITDTIYKICGKEQVGFWIWEGEGGGSLGITGSRLAPRYTTGNLWYTLICGKAGNFWRLFASIVLEKSHVQSGTRVVEGGCSFVDGERKGADLISSLSVLGGVHNPSNLIFITRFYAKYRLININCAIPRMCAAINQMAFCAFLSTANEGCLLWELINAAFLIVDRWLWVGVITGMRIRTPFSPPTPFPLNAPSMYFVHVT